ncbi:unnamed protein product [Camellia sinensis]
MELAGCCFYSVRTLDGKTIEADSFLGLFSQKEISSSCQVSARLHILWQLPITWLELLIRIVFPDPIGSKDSSKDTRSSIAKHDVSLYKVILPSHVAPGSRSSPLAISASTHPHKTCISCFDERSLAFHAVGYARGSHKPAVVITSSGTAVSNLLPAEASQDFVPLLLLTADRPPGLHEAGANQAINQVNHFGLFVRFFYGLPASTDSILARMVLATLDSAVYWATSSPYGPYSYACNGTHSQVADVLEVIQVAKQGLLLIGAIHRDDDIWAALLLAKHLSWPVVADILGWAYADVIVQIGSRITSKQISWMLEDCFPCSYIVVENHPSRRDPSHIVTHRIQSTIAQFADCMLKAHIPQISSKWSLVARWAQQQGKMSADICMAMNKEPSPSIAHGLGTYHWLKEDITAEPQNIRRNTSSGFIEASVDNVAICWGTFKSRTRNNVLVFLHGFLGTGEDWIPIMKAISGSARCIAVDLLGLGRSKMQNHCIREAAQERSLSIEVVADILQKLIQNITPGKVTLVGYSMGARIALYMALRCASKFEGAVISGSPGLKDVSAREIRKAKDDSRACSLINHGIELFLDTWYAGALWNSLRDHPHFKQMVASRLQHDDAHTLAKVLSDSSIGRQLDIWELV